MGTHLFTFSVIIPTLNEELCIADCINHLRTLNPEIEIIVADGGSTDATLTIAESLGATVLTTARGRGYQLNAGADRAKGDIFLFLHADTRLPDDAFFSLSDFFSDQRVQIGIFRLALDISHWILKWYTFCSRFDSVFTRFGDHCIIVRRGFFYRIAGYPNWPLFEEVKFLQKARVLTKIHLLPKTAVTSARRFVQNGIVRQYFFDAKIMCLYLLGKSPYELAQMYTARKKKNHTAIILFARYPVPGKVKSRLAKTKGKRYAALVYKRIAEKAFRTARSISNTGLIRYIFVADSDTVKKTCRWARSGFLCLSQTGHDLGQRMEHALCRVFSYGAEKVVIVGTDIPDLSRDIIENALRLLDSHQIVLGPTHDGGYYLLGMKKMYRELFRNIPWSTPDVLPATLSRIENLKAASARLPLLRDIDTEEDLKKWKEDKTHAYSSSGQ
ncbi:MAG: TIGR04283 family arsenosugar biosynthesis glycosyltransferase [Candidatus Omnitrophica bacterium]|nr:TIGR04283 family arsenosugar biosynthesis glycosyltransferase [Candidatus Omnitrophota bacterium]